jgi:hypothetical protein
MQALRPNEKRNVSIVPMSVCAWAVLAPRRVVEVLMDVPEVTREGALAAYSIEGTSLELLLLLQFLHSV